MAEEFIGEPEIYLEMYFRIRHSLVGKIKRFIFNKNIFISIILFGMTIVIISKIYFDYNDINPIIALIIGSFWTLLFIIIWESYNSMNMKSDILLAFNNELVRNWGYLRDNFKRLKNEQELINNKQIILSPIFKVQFTIYELIVQTFPRELVNMELSDINQYIKDSHEINELIRTREGIQQHKHMDDENYRKALKKCNNLILTKIKVTLDHIIRLLDANGKLIKLDNNELNKLLETKNLDEFSKFNKLNKDLVKETVKVAHKKNASMLIIFSTTK